MLYVLIFMPMVIPNLTARKKISFIKWFPFIKVKFKSKLEFKHLNCIHSFFILKQFWYGEIFDMIFIETPCCIVFQYCCIAIMSIVKGHVANFWFYLQPRCSFNESGVTTTVLLWCKIIYLWPFILFCSVQNSFIEFISYTPRNNHRHVSVGSNWWCCNSEDMLLNLQFSLSCVTFRSVTNGYTVTIDFGWYR